MTANSFAKLSSIIAIILSLAGMIYVGYSFLNREQDEQLFQFVWGAISWCLVLWGSIIGFQTCHKYHLEQDDARYLGYVFCGVLGIFISHIMGASSVFVISFLFFTLILNRKKKIIQKEQLLNEK